MKRWLMILPVLGACSKDTSQIVNEGGGGDTGPLADTTPPVIAHTPIDHSEPYGVAVDITATITETVFSFLSVALME